MRSKLESIPREVLAAQRAEKNREEIRAGGRSQIV
jgi:hypothetical protein